MHLTLRQRLALVALMCATLILLPASQLGLRFLDERRDVAAEQAALPASQGWLAALNELARHRSAAAVAALKPEAARQRDQAAQALATQGPALLQALADAGAPAQRQQAAAQWLKDMAALAAQLKQNALPLPELMRAHQQLADRLLAEAAQLNADAGLLLDAQPATHFAIVAGLQLAPRLTDTLSELSTLAEAAAVDDVAALASAATRYRGDSTALAQQLEMAERLDPDRAEDYRRTRTALLQQRGTVLEALEASAKDVNYPLDKLAAAFEHAARLQTDFSRQASEAVQQRLAERAASVRRHAGLTLLVLALGLGAVGWALWRTARGIVGPVQQAIAVTERIAEGDLSVQIPPHGQDDMGRVLQAIAGMQARLKALVLKLQQASGEIHQAADEIAAGHHDLSQRSESAASRLQEATGSVELLSGTVATTARAAQQARQLAESAWSAAGDGRGVVQQFLQTMESIDLSARRMSDIVTVIDGIAFQTNILALNAAVEAARAGEQGRGFAVVAAEVRSLAQRSASAAREVKGLIHESVSRVERGAGQVTQASDSMHAVAERIGQVKALIEGIALESQGESARMDELSRSVGEIDQMSQQNAALVEQAAAAAASLNQQAEQMAALAGTFRLQPA